MLFVSAFDEIENWRTNFSWNVIFNLENVLYWRSEDTGSNLKITAQQVHLPSDLDVTKNQRSHHSQNATFTLEMPLTSKWTFWVVFLRFDPQNFEFLLIPRFEPGTSESVYTGSWVGGTCSPGHYERYKKQFPASYYRLFHLRILGFPKGKSYVTW